jgi:hypothetical protein
VQGLAEADRLTRPASLAGGMPHRAKSVFEFTDEQMMIAIASLEKKSRK